MPTCIATGVNGRDGIHCRIALRKLREKERAARRFARPPGSDPNPPKSKTKPKGDNNDAPARAKGQVGRPAGNSKFSGLTITSLVKENPRRAGTHGQKSFDIILRAGGSIKYEDYKERGGRNNDLQWDIDHKFVEVK